jgi:hypothetical protein
MAHLQTQRKRRNNHHCPSATESINLALKGAAEFVRLRTQLGPLPC